MKKYIPFIAALVVFGIVTMAVMQLRKPDYHMDVRLPRLTTSVDSVSSSRSDSVTTEGDGKITRNTHDNPKPSTPVPSPSLLPPLWPASTTIDWELRTKLPRELVAKINQSPVPVLMPSDVDLAKTGIFVFWQKAVNIAFQTKDLSMSLLMTWIETNQIPNEFHDTVRGAPAELTGGNEDGWQLQWHENGILYVMAVYCPPLTCKDTSYVVNLAESLRYVGGEYVQGGAQ